MKKSPVLLLSLGAACIAGVCAAPLMISARAGRTAAPSLLGAFHTTPADSPLDSSLDAQPASGFVEVAAGSPAKATVERPQYYMDLDLDWKLLSFRASSEVVVPVRAGDSVSDAVLFVFANAGGVGGADASHANIAIDSVTLGGARGDGAAVPWKLDGAVLRVQLPQAQRSAFTLRFAWHGVVPRLPASDGGIGDLMGGAGANLDDMLGGILGGGAPGAGAEAPTPKREDNTDYGLYAYGNGVLSLGSFWYPTLAVRQGGRWIDEAPRGLGDVSYAEQSDYSVTIAVPPQVLVAAPGQEGASQHGKKLWRASGVRDFAVLASDSFVRQGRDFNVGGRNVRVEAFTTRARAAKSAQAIDVAGHALQIFARRFGPYPRDRFAVVEGPLRAGAGGMEYSGMTAIASALYGDLQAQLGGMAGLGSLGDAKLGGLLGDIEKEAYGEGGGVTGNPAAPQAAPNGGNGDEGDILGGLAGIGGGAEMEGLGAAGDLLKQQGAILGTLFETTIAHETAHQWWAIGVGSDSQRAPWVDESLTNWSAMLYFEDRYSRARSAQMMEAHLKTAYATARMIGAPDERADMRTSDYASSIQYGAMIYGKGALFYARLREVVGDAAFFGALQDYFAGYSGRLSDGRALVEAFKRAAPSKSGLVQALFARWIQSAHGDEDITGGAPPSLADMLGGALGGAGGLGAE